MGVWCEEHKLPRPGPGPTIELAVKRESTFEPAHRKLGHVLLDGRWLNGDELKEAQGAGQIQRPLADPRGEGAERGPARLDPGEQRLGPATPPAPRGLCRRQ